ncbi:MAG: LarC family nickel insertion protein [Dongiaceae bacterium]
MADHRHIHLDALGGIAGDMFVAAMLDALPELRERTLADAASVLPMELGRPALQAGKSGGVSVVRFGLPDKHDRRGARHQGQNSGGRSLAPARFAEMNELIGSSALHTGTAEHASAILRILAMAESQIHGVPIEDVHFHELSDWDSIMDVVAAGSIAAALIGARWSVSDLPRGGGFVLTEHGHLPVPAPATAVILAGYSWRDDGISGERVTPTGAAILRHLGTANQIGDVARLASTGMGAGTRDLPGLPNILRALVFVADAADNSDSIIVLSFDIDDMTGEEMGTAMDRLRAADGVLDVSVGNRIGKKGRPLQNVRMLVRPADLAAVQDLCFRETSTIGLRWHWEQRARLERRSGRQAVGRLQVGVKEVRRPGGVLTVKAESDDIAGLDSLSLRRVTKAKAEGSSGTT